MALTESAPHIANRLLMTLPSDDLARLHPHLELVSWPLRMPLNEAGAAIDYVYFPTAGFASIVAYMSDGAGVETGVVGSDGMLGLPALSGSGIASHAAFVQVEGSALRIATIPLREEFGRGGALHGLLSRYGELCLADAGQLAACNARHTLPERLARWLLRARDALARDHFPLTHEFAGMMLGVRRAGVSVAARGLLKAGLIEYQNGLVTILDGPKLEAAACECYRFMARTRERLLPFLP
jgi:CRP-like cAMP-binding protein